MNQRKILKNKWFLYLTEFFSGVSLMAVEPGASRLLAPYFSSSQIVWTIIIGTIMIAMALGNVWGGRSADRDPDPDWLYRRILFAAVWIACIPLLGKYVIAGITVVLALFVTKNFLVWAAFAACLVLFVCPLLILGTVTPSLVKYTVDSLEDSGKAVGTMEALNTIGSIIGTPAHLCHHPGGGHLRDLPDLRGHPAGPEPGVFSQRQGQSGALRCGGGGLPGLLCVWKLRLLHLLGE